MLADTMLNKKTWAVVGANQNREKYGNKIYRHLKEHGYETYAVNPGCDIVEGDPCYPDLTSLPKQPDVLNLVVSPKRGKPVMEEAARLGIKYIWLQPGTYDDELMALINQLGLEAVQNCVLISV